MVYKLYIGHAKYRFADDSHETYIGYAKDAKSARRKAILKLIEQDKQGYIVYIYRDDRYVGVISMQTGPYEYLKPSKGLKEGYEFMFSDLGSFYDCKFDGSLKEW